MDLSSAMFSFLSQNQPHSRIPNDPMNFLLSPATDADDTAITTDIPSLPPHSQQIPSQHPHISPMPSASSVHPSPPSHTLPNCPDTVSHLDNFLPNSSSPSPIYDPSLSAAPSSLCPLSFLPLTSPSTAAPSSIPPVSNSLSFSHTPLQSHPHLPQSRIQSFTYQSSQPLPQNNPNISLSLSTFALASSSLPSQNLPFSSAPTVLPPSEVTMPTPNFSPPPYSRTASLTHSCGTANQSTTTPPQATRRSSARLRRACKRDRSLHVMKAIAANSAPDVLLSDSELLEIGAMHESESQLAQSRELYMSLASFKRVLSKYGYRLSALHLDVVSDAQTKDSFHEPFDFVLNKSVTPDKEKTDSGAGESPILAPQDTVPGPYTSAPNDGNRNNRNDGLDDLENYLAVSASVGSITGKRRRYSGSSDSSEDGDYADDVGLATLGMVPNGTDSSVCGDDVCVIKTEQSADEKVTLHDVEQDDENGDSERPYKRARRCVKGESAVSVGQRLGCVVCGKMMSDNDTLVRHFRHAHQELKPFSCPRCRGFYSSEGTLWHHIRNVHTETPRKYKCSHCDASYDSFGAKTRHEHGTHNSGSSRFICSFKDCGRAFVFPAHLEAHALHTHPGFRPFACGECPKSFPSANGLTRHAREVHQRPQAYSCSCNRSYSKRCHLKRHLLRVHGMSVERVQEEMNKQPHPGLLHMVPRAPPASTD